MATPAKKQITKAKQAIKKPIAKAKKVIKKPVAKAKQAIQKRTEVNKTTKFDGTPVFTGMALMLQDARNNGWKGHLNSADRRKGVAERYGKMSQAALYAGWLARRLGFFPANPPGRSSHELRSDGVCYRGPVGRPLAWWQLGLDVTEAPQLVQTLNKLGYSCHRPYSSPSEAHHVNLHAAPVPTLKKRRKI